MALTTADVCPRTCFKKQSIDLDRKIVELRNGDIQNIEIPISVPGCAVCYSPVGNYAEEPIVIICGKTPSDTTQQAFISRLKNGQSFDDACYSTIYANMRENLFKYFYKIGLFSYLSKVNPIWHGEYKTNWDKMFTDFDFAKKCSIQLTQACNCAIFNIKNDGNGKSAEPSKSAFNKIQEEFKCLFEHFSITEKTKLIIFLDTPSKAGNKFHQEYVWEKLYRKVYPQISVISITHPSTQNLVVYNNLDNIENMPENNKKKNAIKLFRNAESVVRELMQEL